MRARLSVALVLAMLAAATMAEAAGKPSFVPPSNPPGTLQAYACSLLPASVQAWIPFCAAD